MTDQASTAAALRRGGLIDMTTTGRRSGQPRRIELGLFHIDGRLWITGRPGRRDWIANLRADARLTVHLKRGLVADVPARARIVTDEAERRTILRPICAGWQALDRLELFVAQAPLIEVTPDDPTLLQS
jgi:deazaflavin-dependent oxidoreductase (nitroreductase family)